MIERNSKKNKNYLDEFWESGRQNLQMYFSAMHSPQWALWSFFRVPNDTHGSSGVGKCWKNVPGRFWSLNWLYFAIFGPDIAFYVQYGQAEVPPTLPEWQVTQTNNFRPVGTELVACVGLTHSYMLLDWSKVQIHHFFMLFAPLKTRWGPVTWARARFSKVQTPLS